MLAIVIEYEYNYLLCIAYRQLTTDNRILKQCLTSMII
jgi:hypothetical protein